MTAPHRHTVRVPGLLIGYARCSTDAQDLTAQRDALTALGVAPERIYVDHGLTGTNRPPRAPGGPRGLPRGRHPRRLLFNALAMIAEFEADLVRM